jgi:hypothetical protein
MCGRERRGMCGSCGSETCSMAGMCGQHVRGSRPLRASAREGAGSSSCSGAASRSGPARLSLMASRYSGGRCLQRSAGQPGCSCMKAPFSSGCLVAECQA